MQSECTMIKGECGQWCEHGWTRNARQGCPCLPQDGCVPEYLYVHILPVYDIVWTCLLNHIQLLTYVSRRVTLFLSIDYLINFVTQNYTFSCRLAEESHNIMFQSGLCGGVEPTTLWEACCLVPVTVTNVCSVSSVFPCKPGPQWFSQTRWKDFYKHVFSLPYYVCFPGYL